MSDGDSGDFAVIAMLPFLTKNRSPLTKTVICQGKIRCEQPGKKSDLLFVYFVAVLFGDDARLKR